MTLKDFFENHNKAALGFSGGVDSAYLLFAAKHFGCDIRPYYIKTQFQPEFELADAKRLCAEIGVELCIIEHDILNIPEVVNNYAERCYFCKKSLFSVLRSRAVSDGYSVLLDGTNASDDASDRPGTKALCELEVLSPLRSCGLTKSDIRSLSKESGLFTWDKPAYACLSTRIPTGTEIKKEQLQQVEAAEKALSGMGFNDFRVRCLGEAAKIQLKQEQFELAFNERKEILKRIKPYFNSVLLDLEER